MSSSNMIVINQLNSHYRGHQALCDVSLTIVKSQVTVIMGVSGCGKTTLLRRLVGLKPTEPGRIFVEGNALKADIGRARAVSLPLEESRRRGRVTLSPEAIERGSSATRYEE